MFCYTSERKNPGEHQRQRQLTEKPLVEAFFKWLKKRRNEVLPKSKTGKGLTYCLN
ncbi:transposase [Clostridium tyrobutyricum]|nr:transposase [Clostridium tyrobutyricum]MBV4417586.1 IS66 family transposase [Clostridium tyrobutyricum]MBV4418479.1 IS66 family transposase [Clostridium tyrobutyricum]MBV4423105.1 IS66 family transposase [Clostridium tyrobutyricum]MBV4426537.1 IS66 family transposase [Clostridium tyrobutyricum]